MASAYRACFRQTRCFLPDRLTDVIFPCPLAMEKPTGLEK